MGYVIFILILLLLVAFIVTFTQGKENISRKGKLTFTLSAFLLIVFIAVYNYLQDKKSEETSLLRDAFLQGKPLKCKSQSQPYIITKDTFNFSNGTMSFLGKPNTEFNHLIIPLQECTIEQSSISKN